MKLDGTIRHEALLMVFVDMKGLVMRTSVCIAMMSVDQPQDVDVTAVPPPRMHICRILRISCVTIPAPPI